MLESPAIANMLDLDFYKLSMGYFVWKLHSDAQVKYALTNRGKFFVFENTKRIIAENIELASKLRFTEEDLAYVRKLDLFEEGYIEFLRNLRLPEVNFEFIKTMDHYGYDIKLTIEGLWSEAIYWETFIMSILSQAHHESSMEGIGFYYTPAMGRPCYEKEALARLKSKLDLLSTRPGIRYSDFGTRRRSHRAWHEKLVGIILENSPVFGLPQFAGTSNVDLARKYKIKPIGTMAHELFMAYSALCGESDAEIRGSSARVLNDWQKVYGLDSSIALTDTWGSDFFFSEVFDEEKSRTWKGIRQDSGNPYRFGVRALNHYNKLGIKSSEKTLVFSDSLDANSIVDLYDSFNPFFNISFGWGTQLTNDFYETPLNIVVKLSEVNGIPVVKLSDTPSKAMGNVEQVEKMKGVYGIS